MGNSHPPVAFKGSFDVVVLKHETGIYINKQSTLSTPLPSPMLIPLCFQFLGTVSRK